MDRKLMVGLNYNLTPQIGYQSTKKLYLIKISNVEKSKSTNKAQLQQLANVQQQEKKNKSKRTFQLTTFVSNGRRGHNC